LYVGKGMQGVGKVRLLEIAFEEAGGARTCFVAKHCVLVLSRDLSMHLREMAYSSR